MQVARNVDHLFSPSVQDAVSWNLEPTALPIKNDVPMKMLMPTIAVLDVARRDEAHRIRKVFLTKPVAISCEHAATIMRQPGL